MKTTILMGCAVAVSLASATAFAEDLWVRCGSDGQTCTLTGEHRVRFGVRGKQVTKTLTDAVACTTATFGDPAPGEAKSCEYLQPETWEKCADENKTCSFSGSHEVRYGAKGKFAKKTVTDTVKCSNAVFGDPIVGVAKTCELVQTEFWLKCATEGKDCKFSGAHDVRYGAKGKYATKSFTDTAACNNKTFGDPIPGVAKSCEFKQAGTVDPKPYTNATECKAGYSGSPDEATACAHCVSRAQKSSYDSTLAAGKRCQEIAP